MKKIYEIWFIMIGSFLTIFSNFSFGQNSWVQIPMSSIIHQIVSRDGILYAAGGYVFRSTDGGQNWVKMVTGLPAEPSALSIGISYSGVLFIGTFYNGVFRSTNQGNTWDLVSSAIGNISDFEFNTSGTIFASSSSGLYRSTNNGNSWVQLSAYNTQDIVRDKNNGKLYAVFQISDYQSTVYVSTNDGDTWDAAGNGLINGAAVIRLGINTQGYIFAGTMYNGMFRSTNGGSNWVPINYGTIPGYYVEGFAFKPNQIFACTYENVYYSTDNGDSWGTVNNGLGDDWTVHTIFPLDNSILIAWWSSYIPGIGYGSGLAHRSNFSTSSVPPLLISPPNNSNGTGSTPILKWKPVSLTGTYKVQAAVDSLFSNIILETANIPDTSFQLSNLQLGTKYYWRVNETNFEGTSGWSYEWNFTLKFPPLKAPTLLSPLNGTLVSSSPILIWGSEVASKYGVQVAEDSSFTNIVHETNLLTDTALIVYNLQVERLYYWRVRTIRTDSTSSWSLPWHFITSLVGIKTEDDALPNSFFLYKNYPNPFNPSTTIKFAVPKASFVKIKVYDLLGKELQTLLDKEMLPGVYDIVFDGRNLPSGVYLLQMQSENFNKNIKLLLQK